MRARRFKMKIILAAAFMMYITVLIVASLALRPSGACGNGQHGPRIGHVLVIGRCR
jgi:hypothetical protein